MASRAPDNLYAEVILEHNRHPRNRGKVEDADISGRAVNPFCGDEVDLQIVLVDGRVARVGLQAQGCAINQASGSVLTTAIEGKTLEQTETLSKAFRGLFQDVSPSDDELCKLGELCALSGVREFPIRIKCALLPWSAMEDAIEEYRRGGTARQGDEERGGQRGQAPLPGV